MAYEKLLFNSRKILVVPRGNEDNTNLAATALKNLSDYGFTINEEGFKALCTASEKEITDWYYDTSKKLNELAGGNHTYLPFYPNFPKEVMEASEVQLFVEQMAHYCFGYRPKGVDEKENIHSLEEHPLKVLMAIPNDEDEKHRIASEVFQNMLANKETPSADDYSNIIMEYINESRKNGHEWLNQCLIVNNRNTLCLLYATAMLQRDKTECLPKLVTNDYLRVAKFVSSATINEKTKDVTFKSFMANELPENFKGMPRSTRKFICDGLDKQKNLEGDVARDIKGFKKLFRVLHPESDKMTTKMYNLRNVAHKVHNNIKLNTLEKSIERAMQNKEYTKALKLYEQRPGIFLQNMNRFMSIKSTDVEQMQEIASQFIKTVDKTFPMCTTESLLKAYEYINSRTRDTKLAIHNVDGKNYIGGVIDEAISEKLADTLKSKIKDVIADKEKNGQELGKVYIDSALKDIPVYRNIKSDSVAMETLPKGASFEIEKNNDNTPKNIRVFIWWTNQNCEYGRVDLDLSTTFYKKGEGLFEDKKYIHYEEAGSLSYHSGYRDSGCVHSGDITDGGKFGGKGAAEFVDLDLDALKKHGVEYVKVYVNSYTGQPLTEIPCLCGYQERKELDKSEKFDIKAVKQTSQLTTNAVGVTPIIVDVNNAKVLWIDEKELNAKVCHNSATNYYGLFNSMDLIMEKYVHNQGLSMYELAELSAKARGSEIIENKEEADTLFLVNVPKKKEENQRIITAKDKDIWLGEFMTEQFEPKDNYEIEFVKEHDDSSVKDESIKKGNNPIDTVAKALEQYISENEVNKDEKKMFSPNEDPLEDKSDEELDDEELDDEELF